MSTYDNRTLNLVVLAEIFLAIMLTRGGALSSLLGTVRLTSTQWLLAIGPPVLLFILWEGVKFVIRRQGLSKATASTRTGMGSSPVSARTD
jgi:hypothetical protein